MVARYRKPDSVKRHQREWGIALYTNTPLHFSLSTAAILERMEYQVPQFIEVEDKIVGPLTLRQFIYIAGAVGLCVVFFFYVPTVFAFVLSALVVGFAAALAFYKVNGKPFIEVLEAGFNYYTGSKLFLWKHEEPKIVQKTPATEAAAAAEKAMSTPHAPKLTRGKLSEHAWSLDVKPTGGDASARES